MSRTISSRGFLFPVMRAGVPCVTSLSLLCFLWSTTSDERLPERGRDHGRAHGNIAKEGSAATAGGGARRSALREPAVYKGDNNGEKDERRKEKAGKAKENHWRSPRRRRASWMSARGAREQGQHSSIIKRSQRNSPLGWMVTRLAWMAAKLVSSKSETR